MIEPVLLHTTRPEPGSIDAALAVPDFGAIMDRRLGVAALSAGAPDARGDKPKKPTDIDPSLGPDVDLAAIAAAELTTRGTPRADVAAASEAMRSPGDPPTAPTAACRDACPSRNTSNSEGRGTDPAAPRPAENKSPASNPSASDKQAASPTQPDAAAPQASAPASAGPPRGTPPPQAKLTAVEASTTRAVTSIRGVTAQAPQSQVPAGSSARPGATTSPLKLAAAPRPTKGAPESFAAQLKRGLAAVLRQSGGSVTLRMAPESLGQVRIRLNLDQGSVSGQFDVGSHEARRLLDADMGVLRSALEARGLKVDDLHVTVRPELAGTKDPPAHLGEPPADPQGQWSTSGGARDDSSGAGARPDPAGAWQEAAPERDGDNPTIDPWAETSGGAVSEAEPGLLRLRLDAVA